MENEKLPEQGTAEEQNANRPEQKIKKPLEKRFLIYYSIAFLVFALIILALSYLSTLKQQGMNEELKKEVSSKVEVGISALARLDTLTQENAAYQTENAELKLEIESLNEKVLELESNLSSLEIGLSDTALNLDGERKFLMLVVAFYKNDPNTKTLYKDFIENYESMCTGDEIKPILEEIKAKLGE